MELGGVAAEVRERTSAAFTDRDAERILAAILSSEDIWRVIDLADVPVMALCAALEVMGRAGWVEFTESRIRLTDAGRKLVQGLGIAPARELRCGRCGGRGLELGPVAKIAERFKRIVEARPEAIQEFDQGYVTEESTLYRVAFMWARGDLVGKELLVLGDDDLVSIAAALTGAPRRVVVLDIDERILEFVREVAQGEGLCLEVRHHDLRNPLPAGLLSCFDVFFCDPTESLRGFLAFAGRGISALRAPGCAGYLGLTRREASLLKWQAIQRELLSCGAAITDIRDDFHEYVNWPYIETMRAWDHLPARRVPGRVEPWYRSALIRIELVEPPKAVSERLEGDIFTDPEAATT
ncbi:MAG: Uncharacterized protein XD60_0580 [Acetothermia bacterium 64_32]|nr:MAG: Uncharacterized protein XD60_0580 [Acetothermia bacterium 64_32]HAF71247.1 putative methyltransferase [Candidatus Acetothermia bacterium]